jgi:hypothetical protein
MSYTYLLEQGEESSAASFSDIPQSVLSRLNLIAGKSCCKGSETESYQSSQSGMMSPPSTELRGGGKSMSSAEDSLARTSQAQGGGAGIEGERSGLWSEMARIIGEIRPKFAFMENSPMLTFRGLGRVLGDLSELGYDARWGVLGAHHVGAPHRRDRIWIVGNSVSERLEGHAGDGVFFNQCRWDFEESRRPVGAASVCIGKCDWWASESGLDRVVDGVANLMDRIRCIGNGQVPIVAALAFQILGGKLK